ncbi:aspartyl-phosphate phosphatase Spo0E family protein [Paradesulfitobacterium ferrireducens]|uniref:aspartyl-phosphate phosphatase Spo0E family protein n=1 Tax=Paradesulfitobacterium ferrireducens TaxID=2816476 RepID=UPI002E27D9B8|nr:aspartyl-phosphate phosphatase Spo0E family protein [Paradesulfitobacterium ferrireducens]
MELELDILLNMIEESRRRMNESARDRSLTDPDVVQISQGLDRLLNQYYEMVYRAG